MNTDISSLLEPLNEHFKTVLRQLLTLLRSFRVAIAEEGRSMILVLAKSANAYVDDCPPNRVLELVLTAELSAWRVFVVAVLR